MDSQYSGEKPAAMVTRGRTVASFERSPAAYVQKLHQGAAMLQVMVAISIALGLLMVLYIISIMVIQGVPTGKPGAAGSALGAGMSSGLTSSPWFMMPFWVLAVLNLWAVWLFTTREPGQAVDEGETWRVCWRQLAVVGFVYGIAYAVLQLTAGTEKMPLVTMGMSLISCVLGLAIFIVQMNYQMWIGARLGDSRVYWRARKLRWQGPLLFSVGALLLGAGPIIAVVMYWNLLGWTREGLGGVMAKG